MAHGIVKLTLEVEHNAHWKSDATVKQVADQTIREVVNAVNRMIGLSATKAKIVGEPEVTIVHIPGNEIR